MIDPHANYSPSWCTSPEWWSWVEETLGGLVELDPCASGEYGDSNFADCKLRGGSYGENGLKRSWPGAVYCNPPGSNSARSIKPWWSHAMSEIEAGRCTELVFCFFNMEAVFSMDPSPLDLPGWLTMPSKRVRYYLDGKIGKSPRNRTWFWSTCRPATPPITSWIVETGPANVEAIGAEIRKAREASDA